MTTPSLVWAVVLILAVAAFTAMTFIIAVKGYKELKDIFRKLGRGGS